MRLLRTSASRYIRYYDDRLVRFYEENELFPIFWIMLVGVAGIIASVVFIKTMESILRKKHEFALWSSMWGFLVFASTVLLIWIAAFWIIPRWSGQEPDSVGSLGDMFGVVTSLFSGLAFAGLISTLLMQRKELELQRRELRQTRDVFSVQRFENTFFNLVGLLNQYVQALDVMASDFNGAIGRPLKGRAALTYIGDSLTPADADKLYPDMVDANPKEKHLKQFETNYKIYYEPVLGPYLRLFFNILRHIDRSTELSDLEKLEYAKIARSYLSNAEVKIIAFNSLSKNGCGMKEMIARYRMVKYLTKKDAKSFPFLIEAYGSEVFGGRFS